MDTRDILHIVPANDLDTHDEETINECECKPSVEETIECIIVIHNSWDGREYYE